MYYYIYDEFVQQKKYERELLGIEARLADLGISGRVARLALFKNAAELIEDAVRKGSVSTVVVVGNDKTLKNVIHAVATHHIPLGVIPMGPENHIAGILGVPHGVAACEVLSARNLRTLDGGYVNGHWFMMGMHADGVMARIRCDQQFEISTKAPSTLQVLNVGVGEQSEKVNPTDSLLDLFVKVPQRRRLIGGRTTAETHMKVRELEIHTENPVQMYVDGFAIEGDTFHVQVQSKVLEVIVGKERHF